MSDFLKIKNKKTQYLAADTLDLKTVVGGLNTDYFVPSINISFKKNSGIEQDWFNICDDPNQIKTNNSVETHIGNKISIKDGDQESIIESFGKSLKIERIYYSKPVKPPCYKLAFSPGVTFEYQDSLENDYQKELDLWISSGGIVSNFPQGGSVQEYLSSRNRPDNVVGSYAIYSSHSGCFLQISKKPFTYMIESKILNATYNKRKKRYERILVNHGCGKIGHLYAPYWIDAKKTKIKGVQRIVDNKLIYDLPPQEWLDSAVLPIRLDPDVGYTTVGSSAYSQDSVGIANVVDGSGNNFSTGSNSGILDSVSFYVSSDWNKTTDCGVFSEIIPDNTGTLVDNQLKSSGFVSGWNTVSMPDSERLSANTDYFPGFVWNNGDGSNYYDSVANSMVRFRIGASTPLSSVIWSSSNTLLWSLYFTYIEDYLPIFGNQNIQNKIVTSNTLLRR